MTLVSDSVPSLINGVSQQPPTLRLPSQVAEQINAHSSEVDGLRKRPPLEFLAKLSSTPFGLLPYVHTFADSGGVPYVALVNNTGVRVFDFNGAEKTVNATGAGYLASASVPTDKFRCLTVGDFTFILNRDIKPVLAANLSPTRTKEGLVVVRQGAYGRTYTVTVQRTGAGVFPTVSGSYTVPNGDVPSHATQVGTDYIADQIENSFNAVTLAAQGFTMTRLGSVLYFTNTLDDFTLKVEDDFNNNGAVAFKGKTQRFASLPALAPEGFEIEIVGDETTAFDNYYVRFEKINPTDSTGIWRETVQQGIKDTINTSTMPLVLVREADDTFTLRIQDWGKRTSGDEVSNPAPSFVGRRALLAA